MSAMLCIQITKWCDRRVMMALANCGYQVGQLSITLPNYTKAIVSARRIFKLLDTPVVIDSYSDDGLQPVHKDHIILLFYNNVYRKQHRENCQ